MSWNPISSYQSFYPAFQNSGWRSNAMAQPYAQTATPIQYPSFSNRATVGYQPYLNALPQINQINGLGVQTAWHSQLKSLFRQRQAITYALFLRTFAAQDKNQDGKISPELGENGNFLKAISMLPYLKSLGVNNIHLLPIMPVGKTDRLGHFGAPGSPYAPGALDRLNAEFDEPNNGLTVIQEARMFVDAAHRMGIHVMVDVPSCASVDLSRERPDLIARDASGHSLTPTNWVDIRMFVKDSPALRAYYQKFFDLMVNQLGVDGFRVDVARARTPEFWQHFISEYPDKAWLAESYTEEDASPMANIPRDIPEDLLKYGFDAIYGQFHIFHEFDANQYMAYLEQNQAMLERVGSQKSILGSFVTHDDPSGMDQGGALYCKLAAGMMATQPDTNPYLIDGFLTGYTRRFNIFDWGPRPVGQYPDIEKFWKRMVELRQSQVYGPILTLGKFIPLKVEQDPQDPRVIAFLRQAEGRTLLIVANKDVNASQKATIDIPGLSGEQTLSNLAPNYGESSIFEVEPGKIKANIAKGRFYVFEINVPEEISSH